MKKALVAGAVVLGLPLTVQAAGGTTLTSSANPSYTGQRVTFTASYTVSCADGAQALFTIDGRAYQAAVSGAHTFVATVSISSLGVGAHRVVFTWHADQPGTDISCGGSASLQADRPGAPLAQAHAKAASDPSQPEPAGVATAPGVSVSYPRRQHHARDARRQPFRPCRIRRRDRDRALRRGCRPGAHGRSPDLVLRG